MKLNLGCGEEKLEGYVNVDIRKFDGCLQADVCKLPFKNNCIDEIMAIDIYEHISFNKSKELLKHWVDKLKKGGQLFIQGPSLLRIFQYFWQNPNKEGAIEKTIECIFGKQDYLENTHYTVCHVPLMEKYLRAAGVEGLIEHQLDNTNVRFRAIK